MGDDRGLSVAGSPSPYLVIALAALAASGFGMLTALAPIYAAAAAVGLSGIAVLLVFAHRLPMLFLWSLGGLLAGYAFLSRGFAYVGVPPLFVSELVLGLAALAVLVSLRKARIGLFEGGLITFCLWGLFCTVPYISEYGVSALRDAVVWGYAAFAIAVSFCVRREHFTTITHWYGKILPLFMLWVPVAFVARWFFEDMIPRLPISGQHIIVAKAGDFGVHLGGIAAFILLGLLTKDHIRAMPIRETLLWPIWLGAAMIAGAINRGGLLAMSAAVSIAFLLRPTTRILSLLFTVSLIATIFALIDPTIELQRREISMDQMITNVKSVFVDTDEGDLGGTREWRLEWWSRIVNYTFNGEYFWTGKGYGINLAADDGFQGMMFEDNRSPHSGHMTVLARSGVPGFTLWVLLQVGFGIRLLVAIFRARERNDEFLWRFGGWVLIYWVAMLINMSFDVYLEGPQGGIWFWVMIGLGLVVIRQDTDHQRTAAETVARRRLERRNIAGRERAPEPVSSMT